ncbi:TolC family protein [Sphingomonas beigongshangi]|jgi:outer membrane protein, adhesin transport system|uniref:TolC family protein n=1 Tax=Sphingomonas beigongshangi TaxID=2782540 RepID=UPI001FF0707F|nr:TolC family protein [Sphingomonas beigongshangi]
MIRLFDGRRRRLPAMVAACTAVATAAHGADPAAPLTLDAAVHQALAWHPAIPQSVASFNAAGEAVTVARAGYLPRIGAGIGSGYDNRLGADWRPRPQVSGSQMLYDFGKTASAVEAARAGTRIGQADVLIAVDGLIRDTAYAIVEAQRNAALFAIATEQLARIREISALVEKRFSKGATTQSDALQAQSRVAAAEATLAQIEAERRRWASNLAYLLGRPVPPTTIDPGVPDRLMRGCAGGRRDDDRIPAVMRAEAQRDQAAADLRRSRANRLPTIALAGDASADVTGPLSRRSAYSFGLSITRDLIGGNAVGARVRGAEYARDAADAAVRQARNDAEQRLAEARGQIASLERLLITVTARQTNMVETGKLYRLQYLDMGTRTLVDLLNAEQELQQARFDAVNTTHDLRRLAVDCLYYSGGARDAFGLSGTAIGGVTL